MVLLLGGLVIAWFAGALPLPNGLETDNAASDVPIRVDPSAGTSEQSQASRDERDETGATKEPSPTPSKTEEPTEEPEPLGELEQLVVDTIDLTNEMRANAGCGEVHNDEKLAEAAYLHSKDMADNDYFDHVSLAGLSPWDRAELVGYDFAIAENIAMGYASASSVIEGWMNSEGHRKNLLNCDAKAIGLGVAEDSGGQLYWTQMFGSV